MRNDYTGQERLESASSRGADHAFYDTNLGDYDDPGAFEDWLKRRNNPCQCGGKGHCDHCREMVARQREGSERI